MLAACDFGKGRQGTSLVLACSGWHQRHPTLVPYGLSFSFFFFVIFFSPDSSPFLSLGGRDLHAPLGTGTCAGLNSHHS